MKKLIFILSVVLFANQASAWEVFGLNENTKLEDLEVLQKRYYKEFGLFEYEIVPPKPNALGNEYKITYSKKHGICDVAMWAVWDKPYPYGKTVLSQEDFGVALYSDWQKLLSIMVAKYGKEDDLSVHKNLTRYFWDYYDLNPLGQIIINDQLKQLGFGGISLMVPNTQNVLSAWLTYGAVSPKQNESCESGARKDAADENAESMGISSDDF